MMNLYGGQGMGSGGMGAGAGGGITPAQVMQMLQSMQGGGMPPGGGAPPPGGPPMGGSPLAGYIGAPPGAGGMQRPMMPPVAGNPPPAGMPAMGAGGNPQTAQLMQLLAQLKGGQTGVTPNTPGGGSGGGVPSDQMPPPQLPAAQNPIAANPGLLAMLLQHMQGNPQVPQTGAGGFT